MSIVDHKTGMQPFDGQRNVCGSNDLLIKMTLRQYVATSGSNHIYHLYDLNRERLASMGSVLDMQHDQPMADYFL